MLKITDSSGEVCFVLKDDATKPEVVQQPATKAESKKKEETKEKENPNDEA